MSNIEYRVNDKINVKEVRLVDEHGEQLGVLSIKAALKKADDLSLDLVEIAPKAKPPVCKIMDYSKFIYDQKKKKKEADKRSRAAKVETKELRFRPTTDEHDIDIKLNQARKFLDDGNKVRFTVKFRGREITHTENGVEVLNRVLNKLGNAAKIDQDIQQNGNNVFLTVSPV